MALPSTRPRRPAHWHAPPSPPGADAVRAMSRQDRATYFGGWAAERVKGGGINGVYVLICRSPAYVEVEVTGKTRGSLGSDKRRQLVQLLLSDFKQKRF